MNTTLSVLSGCLITLLFTACSKEKMQPKSPVNDVKLLNETVSKTPSPGTSFYYRGNFTAQVTNGNEFTLVPAYKYATKYVWDFGDGSPVLTTSSKNITHIYKVPSAPSYENSYRVTLTATDDHGIDYSSSQVVYTCIVPEFDAIVKKQIANGDGTNFWEVQFFKTTSGYKVKEWDFGTGKKSTDENPIVTLYDGTYIVSLTVVTPYGKQYTVKGVYTF